MLLQATKISFLIAAITLAGCGEGAKVSKPPKGGNYAGANGAAGQSLLDMDPTTMSQPELRLYISQLMSRDQAEARELVLLGAMNKDLCDRLQRLRTDCSASVRLVPDGSEKILGCSGSLTENTSVNHKIEVTIGGSGSFYLSANKTYKSNQIGTGTNPITFQSVGSTSTKAPRFMDLTSFRLVPETGALPAISTLGFELVVNESTVFTTADLISSDDGKYFKINPVQLFEIKKSATCTVPISEIQEIRNRVTASFGGAQTVQPAATNTAPAANTTQPATDTTTTTGATNQ